MHQLAYTSCLVTIQGSLQPPAPRHGGLSERPRSHGGASCVLRTIVGIEITKSGSRAIPLFANAHYSYPSKKKKEKKRALVTGRGKLSKSICSWGLFAHPILEIRNLGNKVVLVFLATIREDSPLPLPLPPVANERIFRMSRWADCFN